MQSLPACCGGVDVHKQQSVACLMRVDEAGQRPQELRTCGTMTQDLLALADWRSATGCTHVAMERTGVYGKPGYHLLEGLCALLVVNAHHLKAVPGRTTEAKDAAWMADVWPHGW